MTYFHHETAIIDPGAKIGERSKVWHWTHVCSGAIIGRNVILGQNVYVANNVTIDDGCKIQNNVSVYDNVCLGKNVFCGPSMVFTNVYNPRAFVERKSEYRRTKIADGATLGANCTIVCGVEIGEYAFVGAGAVVRDDVPPHALVIGVPAKQIGWVSKLGYKLDLPISGKGECVCETTRELYVLDSDKVLRMKNEE